MKLYLLLCVTVLCVGCIPLRSYTPEETTTTNSFEPSQYGQTKVAQPNHPPHLIRVAVAVRQVSVKLLVPSGGTVTGVSSLNARTVTRNGQKFLSFDLTVHDLQGAAIFRSNEKGDMEVNGNRYKGTVELLDANDGYLTVVNQLPMEDYVMGVLAGEVPSSWPMEALKAQAVAGRTFAVYKQMESRHKGLPYDLENNTSYQMYIGSRLVNANIRQAVQETQDEIMTYQDQPIMAVFHSNCGGETTGAEQVWGQSLPYLRPVSCSFDKQGKHYQWQAEIAISEVALKLRAANVRLYNITQVLSIQRDGSGRVLSLTLNDGEGGQKKIKGAAFRMAVGPDVVRSTRFDVKLDGAKMLLTGTGWGHGVGLCQDGACGMAKAGYGAFDILRHYYYGVILDKMRAD
jgi:stage II sporulation protein D